MIIYLDMDDVVADWFGFASDYLGKTWEPHVERIPQEDWNRLAKQQRMYRHLPVKEGAHDLVNYCRDLKANGIVEDLKFLTAVPKDNDVPYAFQDKVLWALERFERIPVLFGPHSYDKWRHCLPGDILIDDRPSNCEEWINAGGMAHVYRSWPECKEWLEINVLE
jgi:5'(3')-deoxyribonucleotidase